MAVSRTVKQLRAARARVRELETRIEEIKEAGRRSDATFAKLLGASERAATSKGNVIGREIAVLDVFLSRVREEDAVLLTATETCYLAPLAKAQRAKLNNELLALVAENPYMRDAGADAQRAQDR